MNRPFVFGTAVGSDHFIGREKEIRHLRENMLHGINTILMSPRRWGKTSLVNIVGKDVASEEIKVVYVDIFSCRDEYDFYNKFAACILRQTESRVDEWKSLMADFLTRLTPKLSLDAGPGNEYSVSLGITPQTHQPEEVLGLPQRIAEKKHCHIVVCLDEFQQVGEFPNSLMVQKKMRSVWQHQTDVSYCLFGSKQHILESLFLKSSHPFYKFGDTLSLSPIATELWVPYLQRGFQSEGKTISEQLAVQLCSLVHNHPSYVQQLAWLTFLNTDTEVTPETLSAGLSDLVDENSSLFVQQTENLTTYQLNFLRAVLAGIHDDYGKASIRETYNLGSYANIARIKAALTNKELIRTEQGKTTMADPVLELWLKHGNIL